VLQWNVGLFARLGSDPMRLAQLGAACFVLSASGAKLTEDARVEPTEEWPTLRLVLLELRECVPRIHGVLQIVGVEGPDAAARALRSATFSPSTAAVVEGGPSATFEPLTIDGLAIGSKSAALTAQVPAGGGFLVFATSYYPGWTVTIDSQNATVLRTNLATMGVRVPEGRHRIEFHFADPGLRLGASLSAVGLAIWLWLSRAAVRSWGLRSTWIGFSRGGSFALGWFSAAFSTLWSRGFRTSKASSGLVRAAHAAAISSLGSRTFQYCLGWPFEAAAAHAAPQSPGDIRPLNSSPGSCFSRAFSATAGLGNW